MKLDPSRLAAQVCLEDLHARLSLIARALTSEAIEILPSEREGGWKDSLFYLPKKIDFYDSASQNAQLYLFRVFYLSIQKKQGFNWSHSEVHSVSDSQQHAQECSDTVLDELFGEYPGLKNIYFDLRQHLPREVDRSGELLPVDLSWLFGRFMRNSPDYGKDRDELENINLASDRPSTPSPSTELEAQSADEVEVLQVDKQKQQEYMLTHNFEKVDTVDEFNGVWRDFDGDDDLNEQAEALQEYNLKHVVRVDDPVRSLYQANFRGTIQIAESTEQETLGTPYLYPEWDYKSRTYKTNYCKLFHRSLERRDTNYYLRTITENGATLHELKKTFALLNNTRHQIRRQAHGEELDFDAVTDLFVEIHTDCPPEERCYIAKKKVEKDLSLLFLLDLSLSSDGYVFGNRIIDIEKQVSILFGEVLNEYGIDFQIDAFYSKTRNNANYITIKGFQDSWNIASSHIGAIEPQGYTRIGPALRHAKELLSQRNSPQKWLILLSDGKPNDYDRYEGRYGVEDIKQALREVQASGINNFALAIEEQAKYYLPQIFGKNHYNILSNPLEMIHALTKLYQRIRNS